MLGVLGPLLPWFSVSGFLQKKMDFRINTYSSAEVEAIGVLYYMFLIIEQKNGEFSNVRTD